MSEDPLALYSIASTMPSSDPSVLPSESDYEAICAAVMETLRGRWFLAEYARRNRHSDTKVVLSAIERIEMMIRGDTVATPAERFRTELADMAKAIARTKSEIAAIKPEAEQPGKILEASEELDSIVHETETATSKILAAAEQVQEIAWTVREQDLAAPICDQLDALATDIYTACSFQDLTGQRIQKVIHAMRYLEERIDTMIEIWDEGVSAQNAEAAKSTAAPAKAAANGASQPAHHPAHHDVALDDLDQTDVDMVMDPAQQEAAVKAEPANVQVVIDHTPIQVAAAIADLVPESMPEPQSFAPEGVVPESPIPESAVPESMAPHAIASEDIAAESIAPQAIATENVASDMSAADLTAAEHLPPDHAVTADASEEVPVFFRAMEPGPVAEATLAEAMSVEIAPVKAVAIEAVPAEVTPAETADIDIVAAPIVEAIAPQPVADLETETAAEPVTDGELRIDLGTTIAAVREALFAPSALVPAQSDLSDAADEPASVGDDEPAAELYEPMPLAAGQAIAATPVPDIAQDTEHAGADAEHDVAQNTAATLIGPAEFLLEPLSPPALRALEAVGPFADREPDTAETTHASETVDVDVVELAVAQAIQAEALPAETDAPSAEAAEPDDIIETVDLDTVGIAPVMTAVTVPEPVVAEPPTETTELKIIELKIIEPEVIEPETSEREAAVIDAVSPEPAEAVEEPAIASAMETADAEPVTAAIEIVEIDVVEAAPVAMASAALEDADIEASAPEAVDSHPAIAEMASEASESEFVEIAEIEAVATAPEPLSETTEETAVAAETDEQAKVEEPEPVDSEPATQEAAPEEAKKDAEEEQRPAARTMMPEVTFASTAPVMMPMETTRTEPAEQRFAAAATVTPTTVAPAQADFIPFGHVESEKPAAPAVLAATAMPTAPVLPVAAARPIAVAAPSIYSTSPYLDGPRPAPAHVTQADPLAAITALTDDEKIALFS